MKVLLLESGTGPGGSMTFLRDFVLSLDRRVIEPLVGLYFPNRSAELDEIRASGVPVVFFRNSPASKPAIPGIRFLERFKLTRMAATATRIALRCLTVQLPQALQVARLIRKSGTDVVLFNQDIHLHIPGVLAAKLTGTPCLCRKAGGIGDAKRIKRVVTPWVDVFVSISKATNEDQRRNPGTKKLLNIYEGVNLDRFRALPSLKQMRTALCLPEGTKVVAAVSRIEEGKGHREFLRMAAQILRHDPEVIFLIVGDQGSEGGVLTEELKALARELNIAHAVTFTGWREDIPSVMAAVDVFVHCPTTWIEGLGIACLEAMAMSLPAVVSENGGLPDSVIDGLNGFVVPVGDIDRMASAVIRLLDDEELRRWQGRNARIRAEQMFDLRENARCLQEVLVACAPNSPVRVTQPFPQKAASA